MDDEERRLLKALVLTLVSTSLYRASKLARSSGLPLVEGSDLVMKQASLALQLYRAAREELAASKPEKR